MSADKRSEATGATESPCRGLRSCPDRSAWCEVRGRKSVQKPATGIEIGGAIQQWPYGCHSRGSSCDGASYQLSKIERDRDRLRQEVLEGWVLRASFTASLSTRFGFNCTLGPRSAASDYPSRCRRTRPAIGEAQLGASLLLRSGGKKKLRRVMSRVATDVAASVT